MMLKLLAIVVLSYLTCEAYKKYATPDEKRKWERSVKLHHGEVGIIMACAGALTKSPNLVIAGASLALHDRDDYKKWFTGDKKSL